MLSAIRQKTLLSVLLLTAVAGLVILAVQVGTLESTKVDAAYTQLDSSVCSRPTIAGTETLIASHVSSVRDIVDPGAANFCAPTNAEWGVTGAFPGDTTIMLEQGQYLVAARLLGQPGDSLRVQWGDQIYPIVAVYGGGLGWKQRYITVIEDRHYMLPIQWNEQTEYWEPYGIERWFAANGPAVPHADDSLEGRCSDCHTAKEVDQSGMTFLGSD